MLGLNLGQPGAKEVPYLIAVLFLLHHTVPEDWLCHFTLSWHLGLCTQSYFEVMFLDYIIVTVLLIFHILIITTIQ